MAGKDPGPEVHENSRKSSRRGREFVYLPKGPFRGLKYPSTQVEAVNGKRRTVPTNEVTLSIFCSPTTAVIHCEPEHQHNIGAFLFDVVIVCHSLITPRGTRRRSERSDYPLDRLNMELGLCVGSEGGRSSLSKVLFT